MNVVELTYDDYLANPQINPALIDIYQDSFGKSVSEAGFTRLIIASDADIDLLQYPIYIEAMCTIEDDGSIWNVCGSIHARSSGLIRRMLQYVAQPGMWLYVDFNNPYWNRAIGLYTAIGFSNPVAEDSYVKLVLDNSQDKIANRKLCNKLRRRYYKNHGYKIVKTLFKTEYLRFFEKLTRVHHREYGGALGIINGEISTIPIMRTGKYIRQKHEGEVLIDALNYLCVFHTHPDATRHIILSPPSSVDLMGMVYAYDRCVTKHYIFESETLGGFWTLQLNPFARSVLQTLSSFTLFTVELQKRLREIEEMFLQNISMDLDSTNYIKNTILNKYLTEINNLRLSSILKSIDDDSCIFFMDYIPWDSIPPEGFEDYIITSNPCGLNGDEGLLLNQDLEGLQSVLMAMDASYNPDHWTGMEIVSQLKRMAAAGLSSDDIIRQILDH